jgi:autotransporter-associated beta strand protein
MRHNQLTRRTHSKPADQMKKILNKLTIASLVMAGGSLFTPVVFASTTIIKSDTLTMYSAADWGGTAPATGFLGQFDSTIGAANEAALTLGDNVTLDGLKFLGSLNGPVNIAPDGNVLTFTAAGGNIDMTAANNDVTINCPVTSLNLVKVGAGRTLTLGGGGVTFLANNATSSGLGICLLSNVTGLVSYACNASPILNMGDPVTEVGGFIISTNSTVTPFNSSFHAGRSGSGLIIVRDGGTLNLTGGSALIIGRSTSTARGKVILDNNGTIALNNTASILIGFQNESGELDVRGGLLSGATGLACFYNGATSVNTNGLWVISGGLCTIKGINYGAGFSAADSIGRGDLILKGGSLYIGPSGIAQGGTGAFASSTTFSGGTLGAFANWSTTLPITLTNDTGNTTFNAADTNGNPFNITLSGSLSGPGGFYKTGGGALTLGGVNTYIGSTIVSNGILTNVTAAVASTNADVTLDGTTGSPMLSMQIGNTGQYWSITNLTFVNGSPVLDFNYGSFSPSTVTAPIQANGNLSFSAVPSVTVEGSAIVAGTVPLIKYAGSFSGSIPATVSITVPGGSANGYLTNITAIKTIALVVTDSTVSPKLTWRAGDGLWDINTTANWSKFGGAVKYTDGSDVQFDDSAAGASPITVTLNTTVNPSSLTASESTKSYIISGSGTIAGATGLLKNGSGSLTLSGTNTYSGGTTLSVGQLNINYGGDGSANSAIGTGPLTIAGGSIGNTSGTNVILATPIQQNWNGDFAYGGSTNNLDFGPGTVVLGQNVNVTVSSNTLGVSGPIADNGNNYVLTKSGAGTLTLSGANSYAGGTVVNAGQLNINYGGDGGADSAIGTGLFTLNNAAIDNTSGADVSLQYPVQETWNEGTRFVGSRSLDLGVGKLTLSAGVTFSLNIVSNVLTTEGIVAGNGRIVDKLGDGTWQMNGVGNNTTFLLTVDAGTVVLNKFSPYIALPIFSGGGNTATVNTNGTLVCGDLGANSTQFQPGLTLLLQGGRFDLFGGNQTISTILFKGGTLANGNSTNTISTLTLTNNAGIALTTTNCRVDVATTSTLALDPNPLAYGFFSGSGSLVKTGTGQLVLSGNNTYTGNTTIAGGTLALTDPNSIGGGTISNSAMININQGATLDATGISGQTFVLNNSQLLIGDGSLNGGLSSVAGSTVEPGQYAAVGTLTVANNISLAGQLLINLNRTNAQNCSKLASASGTITYGGTLSVTNVGPGLQVGDVFHLFPSAVNSFTGISLPTSDANGFAYTWANNVAVDGSISVATVTASINPNPGTIQFNVSGNNLSLAWPTNAGWILQTNSVGLTANAWFDYQGSENLTNINLIIDPSQTNEFFRLVHP